LRYASLIQYPLNLTSKLELNLSLGVVAKTVGERKKKKKKEKK
jgi:hypothetical protein